MELKDILSLFGISSIDNIEQIYKSAWSIDNKYILKMNSDQNQLDKSILLSNLLLRENIPVAEYLKTSEGKPYIQADDTNYCLMRKINGHHLDPYIGDVYKNGLMLGRIIANLHAALSKIGENFDCHDVYYKNELDGWILGEIKAKNIQILQEVIDYCYEFEPLYNKLPRQLIHRDMHLGNLLFDDKQILGYLDFDICQKNARLLDICYLGASMLVGNYQNETRFNTWSEIFRGVIHGYEEKLKLTENEKNAIPHMFVQIELTFTAFFSKIGQQNVSDSCVDMTKWLYRNKDNIVTLRAFDLPHCEI